MYKCVCTSIHHPHPTRTTHKPHTNTKHQRTRCCRPATAARAGDDDNDDAPPSPPIPSPTPPIIPAADATTVAAVAAAFSRRRAMKRGLVGEGEGEGEADNEEGVEAPPPLVLVLVGVGVGVSSETVSPAPVTAAAPSLLLVFWLGLGANRRRLLLLRPPLDSVRARAANGPVPAPAPPVSLVLLGAMPAACCLLLPPDCGCVLVLGLLSSSMWSGWPSAAADETRHKARPRRPPVCSALSGLVGVMWGLMRVNPAIRVDSSGWLAGCPAWGVYMWGVESQRRQGSSHQSSTHTRVTARRHRNIWAIATTRHRRVRACVRIGGWVEGRPGYVPGPIDRRHTNVVRGRVGVGVVRACGSIGRGGKGGCRNTDGHTMTTPTPDHHGPWWARTFKLQVRSEADTHHA